MINTSYFQEYERRRSQHTTSRAIGTTTVTIGDSMFGPNVFRATSASLNVTSGGSNYAWDLVPKYRLNKQYGFIGDVKVLVDCKLEVQKDGTTWEEVADTFYSYE